MFLKGGTGMNKMLTYRMYKNKRAKTTLKFDFDIKKLLNLFSLKPMEAEKAVLYNLNKIELMQFVGLKDKNGKLIYFGDILIDEFNNLLTPVVEISNEEHILFFKPVQYLDKDIAIGCKSTYSETLEVIGNIYNNSELFAGLQEKDKIINLIISAKNNPIAETTIHIELNRLLFN